MGIRVGDTVTFRRRVIDACAVPMMQAFRATVTEITGEWLFLQEAGGKLRVMPADTMCKVARNGVVLELV